MRAILLLFILLLTACVSHAADSTFVLTNSSLAKSTVSSLKFLDDSIEFENAEGEISTLKFQDLLALDTPDSPQPSDSPDDVWIAILTDGSRIGGVPLHLANDRLQWRFQAGGVAADLAIDLATIKSISRLSAGSQPADESITEDCLRLKNGDVVRGIIDDITETTISIRSNGKQFEANRDDVSRVRLANVPADSDPAVTSYVLRLNDPGRSVLRVSTLAGSDIGLTIKVADQEVILDTSLIASLRNTSGNARFLVDLPPKSIEVAGYFASEGQLPQFDVAPARSIQTRSRTSISYDVTGFSMLQTSFEIPPGLDHANVTVRLALDGKTVLERTNVKSGARNDPISLKLEGASVLTLQTDYGENFDVQDRLIWLEPVVTRKSD